MARPGAGSHADQADRDVRMPKFRFGVPAVRPKARENLAEPAGTNAAPLRPRGRGDAADGAAGDCERSWAHRDRMPDTHYRLRWNGRQDSTSSRINLGPSVE